MKQVKYFTSPPILRNYFKGEFDKNLLYFPWKLGGWEHSQPEQTLNPIIALDQVLTEDTVREKLIQFNQNLVKNNLYNHQALMEFSLAKLVRNEILRMHPQYTFKLEIGEVTEIDLYNVQNIYRIGVHKHRLRNKSNLATFPLNFQDKGIQAFFNKRPRSNDEAIISLFLDVSFKAHVKTHLSKKDEIIFENDGLEFHTTRFEVEVIKSDYRSLKGNLEGSDWIRNLKNKVSHPHPIIIDIDGSLNGNPYIINNII